MTIIKDAKEKETFISILGPASKGNNKDEKLESRSHLRTDY